MTPIEYAEGFARIYMSSRRNLDYASSITAASLGFIAFLLGVREALPKFDQQADAMSRLQTTVVHADQGKLYPISQINLWIDDANKAPGIDISPETIVIWFAVGVAILVITILSIIACTDYKLKERVGHALQKIAWKVADLTKPDDLPANIIERIKKQVALEADQEKKPQMPPDIAKFITAKGESLGDSGTFQTLARHVLAFSLEPIAQHGENQHHYTKNK
jgi:hypothetical protein